MTPLEKSGVGYTPLFFLLTYVARHDLRLIDETCDRAIVIRDGKKLGAYLLEAVGFRKRV
ncbi:MAG: hypothetical protein ACREA4_08605 [Nitrososphaera sp.]